MSCEIRTAVRSFDETRQALAALKFCLDNLVVADITDLTLDALIEDSGGGVAGASPVELIVLDNGTPGRLSAGSTGDVLIADSAETLGMKWGLPGEMSICSRFEGSEQTA